MSKTYTERICYRHGIVKPENKVLELEDFNWPKNAIFDYGPFRTLIVLENKNTQVLIQSDLRIIATLEYN